MKTLKHIKNIYKPYQNTFLSHIIILSHQYLTLGTHFGTVKVEQSFRQTRNCPICPSFFTFSILYYEILFQTQKHFFISELHFSCFSGTFGTVVSFHKGSLEFSCPKMCPKCGILVGHRDTNWDSWCKIHFISFHKALISF